MNINQLNSQFAIDGLVEFVAGKGGFPVVKIKTCQASAVISIYAGQVLSYKPHSESEDLIFMSEQALFQQDKAIRGGIPICWPWFGAADNSKNPNHGFVRTTSWTVVLVELLENSDVKVKLELVDTAETQKLWPHSFNLSLDITIGSRLTLELTTKNTGQQSFVITEALHSYFKVADISKINILGLQETNYLDKTDNYQKAQQPGSITFSEETDQIYLNIKRQQVLVDPELKRKIEIASSGNQNVVVWNPWEANSIKLSDLENDDYKHFVCIEAANAGSDKIEIAPGHQHTLMTSVCVIKD